MNSFISNSRTPKHVVEEYIELQSSLNIHPPANRIIEAVIDLVNHYKWEYVTILYQVNI
jgi:hypothetical protein